MKNGTKRHLEYRVLDEEVLEGEVLGDIRRVLVEGELLGGSSFELKLPEAVAAVRQMNSDLRRGDSIIIITTSKYFKPPPFKKMRVMIVASKQSKRRRTEGQNSHQEGGKSNGLELHLVAYIICLSA